MRGAILENEVKRVYTDEELKRQTFDEIITDVINELDARVDNIKVYYPYFIISRKLKAEAESIGFDLTGVFVGLLSFLLYTGKLNGKKIEYNDIYEYIEYFVQKIYRRILDKDTLKKVVNSILDIAQNNGSNFVFSYYSLKTEENKDKYVKLIEIKLGENGKLNYYITSQGIDFYLKTKEFPDATQITINLLLFRKQIEKGSFNYAYDTVRRLNIEVKRKIEQKETVLENLMYGGEEGINEYNRYHEQAKEQFNEEEELFTEVSNLVKNIYSEYLSKENTKSLDEKENKTLELIRSIERELNKAITNHTKLLQEAIDMIKKHDEILDMRRKSAFSEKFKFEEEFEKAIMKTDNPENLLYFISPFLLPKKLKSFNPMNSLETQRIINNEPPEKIVKTESIHDIETIDKITQKRVMHNFDFYFQNLILLLKNRGKVNLKIYANYIIQNYGERALYNADFIAFVLYINRQKIINSETDDFFGKYKFKTIRIISEKEDIDLGNGLKVTNITFESK